MSTNESVVLTAELRDEATAPLTALERRVIDTTRTVQQGAQAQARATVTAQTQIMQSLDNSGNVMTRTQRIMQQGGSASAEAFTAAGRRISGSATGVGRDMAAMATAAGTASGRTSAAVAAAAGRIRDERGRFMSAGRDAGEAAGEGVSEGMTTKMSGLSGKLKGLFGGVIAALGIRELASRANEAVNAFSELEDSTAAAGVVFGDSMGSIIAQSKTAGATLGLSEQQVINAANTYGTYGKAAGLSGAGLAQFSTGLTGLAGDMASFKGTTVEQSIEAIGAALRGETEPIRAYGVMIDDVAMRDEALRQGLIATTKDALTPQQKILAVQALIYKQTADAQGDFARTSDSTANVAKTLAAESENLSAKIGTFLAPAFTAARLKALSAVSGISGFLDKVSAAQAVLASGGTNNDIGKALGLSGPALKIFDEGLGSIRAFFAAVKDGGEEITSSGIAGTFEGLGVALRNTLDAGAKVAQWLWDMRAPIGIIAGLIITALIPHWVALGIEALKSAAQQVTAWAMTRAAAQKAAFAHSIAVTAMVAGWVLMGAQATIQAVKIAAAWVIAMGPIAWLIALIVLAVAALVAGFVWAYNNVEWFRDGVDAALKWIGEAARNVADWIVGAWNNVVSFWQTNVMPGLAALGDFFGTVFTEIGHWFRDFIGFFVDGWGMLVDFYNGVLFPIIDAVGKVFAAVFDWVSRLVWNFATIVVAIFLKIVDLWNGVLLPALQNLGKWFSDIFTWIYDTIIKPYIDLWVGAFHMVVDFWNGVLMPALQAVGDFINTVMTWIYATVIKPVVDLVVGAFQGLVDWWNNTLLPALQAVGDFIGSVISWIYDTIIKPYIDLWVGAFQGLVDWWNNTLQPVIDAVGKWFSDVIGGAIDGVKGYIDGLVTNFQTFMSFVQDKLQPVIDGIRAAFQLVADVIGDVLGKIGEFANNPLGGIQDWLGIKKDGNGQGVMPGASGGASGGAVFSGGGILPGYAPGKDTIPALLSKGEGVAVPELVRAIGPANFMALNHLYSGGRTPGAGPARATISALVGPSPVIHAAGGAVTPGLGVYSSGSGGDSYSTNSSHTTQVTISEGAVQVIVEARDGELTPAGRDDLKDAIIEVFEEINRKSY
ncbi:phage tail protein [Pseudarthrobacter sp. P1]|uniref:phage tail protein n=1 Tax=Pseudarthrobacter sp. P1 TaxID=3418418 RepID=UPI003CE68329